MKKALTKDRLFHYIDGEKRYGLHLWLRGDCSGLRGDCSGLTGDCTNLRGDCSGIFGDCSSLTGNCTGLKGYCTGVFGNLDECELTDEDRQKRINIKDLIGE